MSTHIRIDILTCIYICQLIYVLTYSCKYHFGYRSDEIREGQGDTHMCICIDIYICVCIYRSDETREGQGGYVYIYTHIRINIYMYI
jgi:hypothetical protein